jgi:hypothetical protein
MLLNLVSGLLHPLLHFLPIASPASAKLRSTAPHLKSGYLTVRSGFEILQCAKRRWVAKRQILHQQHTGNASSPDFAIPLRLQTGFGTMSLLNTTMVFGTPVDVEISEFGIETFLPADPQTAQMLRALADEPPPGLRAGHQADV